MPRRKPSSRDVGWVVGVWLRCGLFCANPLRLLDDRLYLFPDPGPVFCSSSGSGSAVAMATWDSSEGKGAEE